MYSQATAPDKHANSGATVIELALVAPILFLLLMGIIEIGLAFLAQNILEDATALGARMDGLPDDATREAYILNQIGQLSSGYLDPDLAVVSTENLGNAELYRVTYPWTLVTPMLRQYLGDANGNIMLSAVAAASNR